MYYNNNRRTIYISFPNDANNIEKVHFLNAIYVIAMLYVDLDRVYKLD